MNTPYTRSLTNTCYSSATPACLTLRASSHHTTRQSYQISTSHKHKQMTKNATVEKKTSAHWTENASHKMSFTKPQSQHKHHQTHTWASPQISKNATGIIQHPFDTKARETKLSCLNTFGHSMTTTNLSPSSGESLSSANLITVLATNVIYAKTCNHL